MRFPTAEAFRLEALSLAEKAKAVLTRDGYHTHILYGVRADGSEAVVPC